MLFSFILSVFIKAMLYMGSAPSVMAVIFISLSISIWISLPLLAHFVSIVKVRSLFFKLPYTKGVAKASIAQAALKLSPVLTVILWPVLSRESG